MKNNEQGQNSHRANVGWPWRHRQRVTKLIKQTTDNSPTSRKEDKSKRKQKRRRRHTWSVGHISSQIILGPPSSLSTRPLNYCICVQVTSSGVGPISNGLSDSSFFFAFFFVFFPSHRREVKRKEEEPPFFFQMKCGTVGIGFASRSFN